MLCGKTTTVDAKNWPQALLSCKKNNVQLTSKSCSGDPFVDQNVMYSPGF